MSPADIHTVSFGEVLEVASGLAKDAYHAEVTAAHLLSAIFYASPETEDRLSFLGIDTAYCREWAEMRMEEESRIGQPTGDLPLATETNLILNTARIIASQYGLAEPDLICLLMAILRPGIAFSEDQLRSLLLTENEVSQLIETKSQKTDTNKGTLAVSKTVYEKSRGVLEQYCVNLTKLARTNRLDPIIGREQEGRILLEIMGRRSKPNVIVIGEPGVGKTALIGGLALNIVGGNVPEALRTAELYELDLGALLAGASYKGETEDRLKKIVTALKAGDKTVLFIDEIHQLLSDNSGLEGLANLLKPELARGELILIGATTQDEYQKYIQKDEAFNRRFDLLTVVEPTPTVAVRMLSALLPRYEAHHALNVSGEAVIAAVKLAKRYLADRRLPDAAIGLLDRSMAALGLANENSAGVLEAAREELDQLQDIESIAWWHARLLRQLSPVLLSRLPTEWILPDISPEIEEIKTALDKKLTHLLKLSEDKRDYLSPLDVSATVAFQTGIPLGSVVRSEQERLLNMEAHLSERLIGQPRAVRALSAAILENRAGLTPPGRPIGSFFLLGPTGTGKTELAKSIAEFLFDNEEHLLRFDMSEFKEAHSAALLYGAPPGYVGYEEGGLLVNKIRRQPYAVCLFDEIEKAHPSVFDIFLQILDEGKLHDRLGKVGDFSNALILFTSNVGSELITESDELPTNAALLDRMKGHFRPEFLGRLTEVIPFAPLQSESIRRIMEIQLRRLHRNLAEKKITLEITEPLLDQLAHKGFSPHHGARPLRNVIRTCLRRPLSRLLISEQVRAGDHVVASANQEGINWNIVPQNKTN